jgi:hypothetical protein
VHPANASDHTHDAQIGTAHRAVRHAPPPATGTSAAPTCIDRGRFAHSFSVDVKQWAIGAGLNLPVATDTDFVGRLAYVKAEVEGFRASADGDGYALSAGLRTVRGPWDLEGAVVYTDVEDEGETTLDLRAQYLFSPEFSVGPTLSLGDNVGYGVNFRYAFR